MAGYGISRDLDMDYDEALEKTRQSLTKEGFGILTEIDVKETLKKKLDEDFRRYIILGACNPPYAFKALKAETDIGLLMPCNVIVYERDGGGSTVSVLDAEVAFKVVGNPELEPLATEVKQLLEKALNSI